MLQYQVVTTGCGGYVIQYRDGFKDRWHPTGYGEIYTFLWHAKLSIWFRIREDAARAARLAHEPKVVYGPKP